MVSMELFYTKPVKNGENKWLNKGPIYIHLYLLRDDEMLETKQGIQQIEI